MPLSSRRIAGLLAASALAAGCGDASKRTQVDVYAAGFERDDAGVATAMLWKNGVSQPLGDAASGAIAVAVTVDGEDVYVVGCSKLLGVTLWKNGVGQSISPAQEGCGEDVVVAGRDVYVAGYETYHPMLWKNGVGEILPHDMTGRADARALAVSGGDVYVAGWRIQTTQLPTSLYVTNVATVWKNGAAVPLTDGLSPTTARGVAVEGQDVYVVGSADGATLWKNGVAQRLGPGLPTDVAARGPGAVVVVGGYSAGYFDVAAVWEGGAVRPLTNGSQQAFAEAVAVAPSGVYVAGYDGGRAVLWHDGTKVSLSATDHPEADAFDVAVVER